MAGTVSPARGDIPGDGRFNSRWKARKAMGCQLAIGDGRAALNTEGGNEPFIEPLHLVVAHNDCNIDA
jgi:hypothetical protein